MEGENQNIGDLPKSLEEIISNEKAEGGVQIDRKEGEIDLLIPIGGSKEGQEKEINKDGENFNEEENPLDAFELGDNKEAHEKEINEDSHKKENSIDSKEKVKATLDLLVNSDNSIPKENEDKKEEADIQNENNEEKRNLILDNLEENADSNPKHEQKDFPGVNPNSEEFKKEEAENNIISPDKEEADKKENLHISKEKDNPQSTDGNKKDKLKILDFQSETGSKELFTNSNQVNNRSNIPNQQGAFQNKSNMNKIGWNNFNSNNEGKTNDSFEIKFQNLMDKINANKAADKKDTRLYIFDNLNSPNYGITSKAQPITINTKMKDIMNYISYSRQPPSSSKNYSFNPSKFNMNLTSKYSNEKNLKFGHAKQYSLSIPKDKSNAIKSSKISFMNITSPRNYTKSTDFSNNFRGQNKSNYNGASSNILSISIKNKMREMAKAKNQEFNYWNNKSNIFNSFKSRFEDKKPTENQITFDNFEERRKYRKNFDKSYFNQELNSFRDKLFGDRVIGGNTSSSPSKGRFNRLKLNI